MQKVSTHLKQNNKEARRRQPVKTNSLENKASSVEGLTALKALPLFPSILEPCPNCETETTFTLEDGNPVEAITALEYLENGSIFCANCGFTWNELTQKREDVSA